MVLEDPPQITSKDTRHIVRALFLLQLAALGSVASALLFAPSGHADPSSAEPRAAVEVLRCSPGLAPLRARALRSRDSAVGKDASDGAARSETPPPVDTMKCDPPASPAPSRLPDPSSPVHTMRQTLHLLKGMPADDELHKTFAVSYLRAKYGKEDATLAPSRSAAENLLADLSGQPSEVPIRRYIAAYAIGNRLHKEALAHAQALLVISPDDEEGLHYESLAKEALGISGEPDDLSIEK